MSLLSMLQDVTREIGVRVPSSAITATDATTVQLLALSNKSGKILSTLPWPVLEREITHTTVAAELQGDLESICGEAVNGITSDTLWDATENRMRQGSETQKKWIRLKSQVTSSTDPHFRVQINPATNKLALYMYPAPAAGLTLRFGVKSTQWCVSADSLTPRAAWGADTDVGIIPEIALNVDLKWRWKQAKRLDYAEEFREAQEVISYLIGEQVSPETIELGSTSIIGDGFPLGPGEGWSV